ncbi:hypothetical protein MTO96_003671 [Rhipicephalus appendiculatus]
MIGPSAVLSLRAFLARMPGGPRVCRHRGQWASRKRSPWLPSKATPVTLFGAGGSALDVHSTTQTRVGPQGSRHRAIMCAKGGNCGPCTICCVALLDEKLLFILIQH